MSDVPSNLIPTRITGLPEYLGASTLGYLPYVLEGITYKVQFANIAAVGAVPSTRQINSGSGLGGGGDLSANRTLFILPGGVNDSMLTTTGVTAATYGSAENVAVLTVNAQGRVTSATNTPIVLSNYVPTSRTITAGTGLSGGGDLSANRSFAVNFSSTTPEPLGPGSPGVSTVAARGDHVHPAVDLSDTTETQGVLPLSRGGTGNSLSPVVGAIAYSSNNALYLTPTSGNAGDILVSGGGVAPPFWQAPIGGGTVTSVNASGGTTGLSFTGGPITTFGTLTLSGTLAVANGGTGASVAGAARTNLGAAASGANTDITSIALTTGTISTTPTSGTDIVNKLYADSIASGINFHQSVRLATATALPANTYNNGASGVGATLTANANGALSVDSVAAVVGNRILVKNEAAQANNGVYTVTQVGSGAAPYVLTRATDFDSSGSGVDQIDAGDFFLVTAGSTQSNTSWVQQTPLPIVVGTTALVFTQFAAPVLYSAGTGLTLAGTVFSITNTGVSASTYGSASSVPVIAFNAQGQATSVTNTAISIAASQITSGTITVAQGGTGATTLGANGVLLGNGTSAVSATAVGTTGQVLVGNTGAAPTWATLSTSAVTSFSAGTTGLTPSSATTGAITLAGTLNVANGGTGATTAAVARTNLGATTVGGNVFTLADPSAITFPRFNADNTVSALDAATFRTAIGAGTGNGTVTSVSGTGTVNGITLTGTVTSSGSLTLGGTLSGVSLTTQVTGTLPVANGGTGATTLTANNVLLGNGTSEVQVVAPGTAGNVLTSDGTTWVSSAAAGGTVSYPQNIQSGNYTLVLSDAGKHIYSANTGTQTITIPTNASVAFPIGTLVTIVNFGTNAILFGVSGVSVYQNGSKSASASPKISPGTSLQLLKTGTNAWNILLGALSTSTTASYLIVAGGASGGSGTTNIGTGGGGAGGLLTGTSTLVFGTTYTITVGAGGAVQSGNGNGNNGSNSSALSVTASGGGGGSGVSSGAGVAGGSGGGGSGSFAAGTTSGGAGTSGQGNNGGAGQNSTVDADAQVGGGGGGASAVGVSPTGTSGGNGGAGTASSITGSSVTYAGGGGGGKRLTGTAGTGGTGGGGNGGAQTSGSAGTANLGGGGGGAGGNGSLSTGGAGGSGVVILSIPTADYTGTTTGSPTVTTSGSNTILTFTSSGSYTA